MYVIKNIDTGRFVAPQGSILSYTINLQNARKYSSLAAANADKCGNEIVLTLEEAMN